MKVIDHTGSNKRVFWEFCYSDGVIAHVFNGPFPRDAGGFLNMYVVSNSTVEENFSRGKAVSWLVGRGPLFFKDGVTDYAD